MSRVNEVSKINFPIYFIGVSQVVTAHDLWMSSTLSLNDGRVTNSTFSSYDYTRIMDDRDIIIFGDPAIDTRFVVELAGPSDTEPFVPFRSVFETNTYYATISDQRCWLHHTAGISSSHAGRSSLQALDVSKNLYSFIRRFQNGVHLLIYVVRTDKPTSNNFRLFYDYLCQQDIPIILVQTTHTPSELSWFNFVLTLDGADPKSDKINLHKAITGHFNSNCNSIPPIERFESTARGCWKLLEKEASWSLADFGDALKVIFKNYKGGDSRCKRIIEDFQMSLNKQSAKNDIQQRVDPIMSTVRAAGNVAPIPYLSVAAESVENIGETVQVCATTTDSRF